MQHDSGTTPASPSPARAEADAPVVWRRPWWVRPPALAAIWGVLVAYGTLIPFDFALTPLADAHPTFSGAIWALLTSPQWTDTGGGASSLGITAAASDLLANLLLYVPLGLALRFAANRIGGVWKWPAVLGACVAVVGLSWSLEAMQSLSPTRVASAQDVLANAIPGVLAVWLAPVIWWLQRHAIFYLYTRTASLLHRTNDFVIEQRRKPAIMFFVVAANIAGMVGWYVAQSSIGTSHIAAPEGAAALPFMQHFTKQYDVAAAIMGRSMFVYCIIGALLSLTMMRKNHRRGLSWVILAVAGVAFGVELFRAISRNARPDITEPLMAVASVGLLFTLIFFAVHACRCSCRRKEQRDFDGPDRRNREHDYGFAIQPQKHA